ncbi:MFS transporter [Desulfovibrio litoralis]|uniref:MFS transporter, NNP family, nitrate/nitrite transporter n=1 Tax=Desulfovibrio litoralis DSM 11393 TaxID=1121455 RepID=A0A1M7RSN1_9BACT|nr:MFS transporter [Desulfovibrio litoralis]SHN49279.1 MFS transporter, NNP family, nitrate/nitrite transporter [Desulfovibrio litoralis DSM 11393]
MSEKVNENNNYLLNKNQLSFSTVVPWILFLAYMFFINYSCRALIGPLLVFIEADFHIDHVEATNITLLQTIGLSLGIFLSSFVLAYLSPKKQIVLSTFGAGFFLFVLSFIKNLFLMKLLFACMGFMAGLYFTAGMASISYLSPTQYWERSISVHELAPPLSFIVTPLIISGTLIFFEWQRALAAMGILAMFSSLVFFIWGRALENTIPRTGMSGVGRLLKEKGLWIFLWLFALGVSGEFAVFSVLPLHLSIERALDQETTNQILSLSRLVTPLAVLLGGWLAFRFGSIWVLRYSLFLQALSLFAMYCDNWVLALTGIIFQPIIIACMFPSVFGYFGLYFNAKYQTVVLALVAPVASILGAGIIPSLLGQIAHYSNFQISFLVLGIFFILSLFLPLNVNSGNFK